MPLMIVAYPLLLEKQCKRRQCCGKQDRFYGTQHAFAAAIKAFPQQASGIRFAP